MKETSIEFININSLFPHPKNPRKDLGDLTELADSIAAMGILQNLTVINEGMSIESCEYTYTVVIGHRRLEAAKLAGLAEVPCVVAKMTEREQLETMLLENVQRSDLTAAEEAQGFHQLRFDMGVSVADIARKIGYSESKVRQRLEIAKLDATHTEAAQARGATMQEIIAVAEVEDQAEREALLDKAGTPNFQWELDALKKRQQAEEQVPEVCAALEEFAVEIVLADGEDMYKDYPDYYEDYNGRINLPIKKIDGLKAKITKNYEGEVFFVVHGTSFYIYKERGKSTKTPEQLRQEEIARELQDRLNRLKSIAETAREKRESFIREYKCNKDNEREMTRLLHEAILGTAFCDGGRKANYSAFKRLARVPVVPGEADPGDMDALAAVIKESGGIVPTLPKFCLIFAYCMLSLRDDCHGCRYGKYSKNNNLNRLYDLMVNRLGYEMSDEEKAYINGTHEAYATDDDE